MAEALAVASRHEGGYGSSPIQRDAIVGRDEELARLDRGLNGTFAGTGSVFMISGEAGIGKSRLIEEFVTGARGRGARILRGRCSEAVDTPAFWVWTQVLRTVLTELDDTDLTQLPGATAHELSSFSPHIRRLLSVPSDEVHDEPADRFSLFDAARNLLRSFAGERATVLVLEDLHAADTSSLQLLRFIADEHLGWPVVIVVSYDDVSVRRSRERARLLASVAKTHPTPRQRLTTETSTTERNEGVRNLIKNGFIVKSFGLLVLMSHGGGPRHETGAVRSADFGCDRSVAAGAVGQLHREPAVGIGGRRRDVEPDVGPLPLDYGRYVGDTQRIGGNNCACGAQMTSQCKVHRALDNVRLTGR